MVFLGKRNRGITYAQKKMNSHSPFDGGCMVAPRPYPARIEHATCRAIDARIAAIHALSLDARFLLVQFVRSVSLKCLSTSVRIRNSTLSGVLNCGVKKVCAIKAELEAQGWIVRGQDKSRLRGMQVSDVWLTPWALKMLGLCDENLEHHAMPVPSEQELASGASIPPAPTAFTQPEKRVFSEEAQTLYLSTTPTERQPAAAPHGLSEQEAAIENQQPTATAPKKAYNEVIPDDLIPLKIAGISIARIRMLMGMASKAGKRLGHIVEVAATKILEANNPFHYTVSLISSPTDWQGKLAHQRKQELQQQNMAKQALCGNQDLETIKKALARTGMIASYKRTHVWKLDDEGVVRKAEIAQLLADPVLTKWQPLLDIAGLAQAIGEGKLFAVDMQDLRDMQGDGQHHEGEGSQQDEQAMPQAVSEAVQQPAAPAPAPAEPAPVAQQEQTLATAPTELVTQPAPSAAPPKKVKPAEQQKPQQPWHSLPQRRELDAIWAAAAQSPDALLSNHKQAKVWKIVDGWLKVTTVQELLNTTTAIINWQPLSIEGVVDFAKRLKQGQLFPVDKQTVQSWCPQPQPAPVQPAMQASTAATKVPDQPSPQPTGTQNWRTSLASLFNTEQGQFQGVGA